MQNGKRVLARLLWISAIAMAVNGCATKVSVDRPCGVLTDSLIDVQGKTRSDDQRISRHFEKGVRAGCWGRK